MFGVLTGRIQTNMNISLFLLLQGTASVSLQISSVFPFLSLVLHVWPLFSKVDNVGSNWPPSAMTMGIKALLALLSFPAAPPTSAASLIFSRTSVPNLYDSDDNPVEMVRPSNPPDMHQSEFTVGTRENDPPTGNFADYRSNKSNQRIFLFLIKGAK